MLRSGIIGKGANDEFPWERVLSQLDPDLPVQAFLAEGIVFAGNALHGARPSVKSGSDLSDGGFVGSPLKQVDQRNLDSVIVIDLVDQLCGCGWSRNCRVVVLELSVDRKVFSVVEEDDIFIVTSQLRAKKVGAHS